MFVISTKEKSKIIKSEIRTSVKRRAAVPPVSIKETSGSAIKFPTSPPLVEKVATRASVEKKKTKELTRRMTENVRFKEKAIEIESIKETMGTMK